MLDNSQRTNTNIQINYILMPDFILLFIKLGTWQQSFSIGVSMAANELLLLLLLVKNLTGKLLTLESVKESRICRDLFCQSSAITFPKEE